MSLESAREHIDVAKKQWERACSDAWEPEDPASCVTNVFYAYENLIVAVAEAHQLKWVKNHYQKADLAHELFARKFVSKDLHDEVLRLNDLRKDVSYGDPGAELSEEDLEGLVTDLEQFLDEVDAKVSELEEADEDE